MMQYGFQRLLLLGSAGYDRAELPLDDSVSLIAPNNTGKTSLINALQFLLIIDRRRMDFGAHEFDKTRRFYFPGNSAYLLLEVSLPQSGTVVLGCVGKGVSHEYEYFAYQGPLEVEDYRLDDGTLVRQPQLATHLAERDRLVFRYNASEFRELIYGGRRTRGAHEPDFTVFRLEHAADAQAFQQVLTRTLRLDKLSSADVKHYLLLIFRRDLPDANIDFKQEWDKAFAEVNAERAQYQAALGQCHRIDELAEDYEARLRLRGKLIDWRPRIEAGLSEWQAYYEERRQALADQQTQYQEEQGRQLEQDRQLTARKLQLEGQLRALDETDAQQDELARRFTLISERRQLEDQLAAAERQRDAQTTLIGQVRGRRPDSLRRELDRLAKDGESLRQQRRHLDDNLYRRLDEALSAEALDRLNRVVSAQVMTLGPEDFKLDATRLREALTQDTAQDEGHLSLAGLELSLSSLPPQHHQLGEAELDERLADVVQQREALAAQLTAAEKMEEALAVKAEREAEVRRIEQDIVDFDALQRLIAAAEERGSKRSVRSTELAEVTDALDRSQETADRLRERLNEVGRAQAQLNQQHERIEKARHQRGDSGEPFSYLVDLDHYVWLGEPDWSLDDLADRLQAYQGDCRQLLDLDRTLRHGLGELHMAGLTKYQYSDSHDQELKRIIEFRQQLPQEKEALEKKARSAVVNVTASLRELRDGLLAFKGKMRQFNRLIGVRQLSDLKTFKIDPQDEIHLVEAINTLIDTAAEVESGDSFELFNQTSVLDDAGLERAKQVLIEEGNARQGLKVADLFRLEFLVGKHDQPAEAFQDIDGAASNGTVLMAKLVTGLAMLHLMQDQRHGLRALCYLDEALALDARNQTSLIDIAHEFGFALIFASPAPLTTARYCVPIQQHRGRNHISRQSWQVLEALDEAKP